MGLTGALAYSKMSTVTSVESADPHRLIQLLIEGAIEKINKAKYFMMKDNIAKKGEHISWSISIIDGLRSSLDLSQGGSVAQNLDSLYDFCTYHLCQANLENDIDKLDEVLAVMNNIREGWEGIREQALEEWKNNG
ncbi:flagellar export chaperone FliS [Pleionea sp. CnH1-48]|uniref:flagellar export chaperone FliS n=1 Tax=Pleionea sp. CnH1-48 TaxID=2954494 RepID=UPI0020976356|nr:flagellar export chaperone FliS [Pleionea sp. CnH1-48]MCO7226148.1 flagellar export chaperone FliS [Pleionea sp. CnH1-48]